MSLVSVIIPTRNRAALLREAIESVLVVQRDGFELEVIVVDDGSTDDTAQVAAAYPVTYLRVEGVGVSRARNSGTDVAHGDYIAFLDDDDLWLPCNVAPQLRVFAAHPEFGAVFGQVRLTDIRLVPYGPPMPIRPPNSAWQVRDFLRSWPQVGSVVVRTAVVREVGGFDPTLRDGEDWEWFLRIVGHYPVGWAETPVALFRQRRHGDDAQLRRGLPARLSVLRRHGRNLAEQDWLWLQRVIWEHRGWYASLFMLSAQLHLSEGDWRRALCSVGYAMAASPAHALVWVARQIKGTMRQHGHAATS